LCTVTIWFDRCKVGIAGCSLYCVPLLFGLTGALLVLLVVCYIVYRYYLVWQVRGWYCWLYVILYRYYLVWRVLLVIGCIVDLCYLVWEVCGWYSGGFVILLTFLVCWGLNNCVLLKYVCLRNMIRLYNTYTHAICFVVWYFINH
jgi:hypothetical protein